MPRRFCLSLFVVDNSALVIDVSKCQSGMFIVQLTCTFDRVIDTHLMV